MLSDSYYMYVQASSDEVLLAEALDFLQFVYNSCGWLVATHRQQVVWTIHGVCSVYVALGTD